MEIIFQSGFRKQYRKLKPSERRKFEERLHLFTKDPSNPILNNHPLKGRYEGYHSINVTGDLRALYRLPRKGTAFFILIDTHSNLYS